VESYKRIITLAAPLEGNANLAAIHSAFEHLNHLKPRALNEPTCGNDHATLKAARAAMVC
jgi:hypothetical protein